MADDGMLLNFDTSATAATVSKPKVKGGRWKDRLSARKGVEVGRRKYGRPGESGANSVQLGPRPVRTQSNTEGDNGHVSKKRRVEETNASTRGPSAGSSREKEVVSSLFTFNPKSKNEPESQEEQNIPDSKPSNAPLPDGAANFTSLGLSATLATHILTKLELKAPTAIQEATIPQLLREDSDAFLQAETGSGKTLAYLLPIVQRLMALSNTKDDQIHRDSGLFAIIMAPTRELCRQIQTVLDSLLRCAHWLVAGSVTGGERKKSEKARLRKGLNILVATPGRLADHLQNTTVLDVSRVRWLVLDEGDRLMELGFEQEIKAIVDALEKHGSKSMEQGTTAVTAGLESLPRRRITVLCSATMKMTVQRLGEASLKDAVHIQAKKHENEELNDPSSSKFTAPAQMKQSYIVVPAKQRLVTLTALLRKEFSRRGSVMKAIVFLSCADSVDFHFEMLRRGAEDSRTTQDSSEPQQTASPPPSSPEPVKVKQRAKVSFGTSQHPGVITSSNAPLLTSSSNPRLDLFRLHGSLAQPVRTSTLRAFSRTTKPAILLCTDVASRGLDLPSIDLVIEYDPAFSAEDHLHRVGRTARAGKEGRAILFLMPGPEEGYVELLKNEGHNEEGAVRKLGRLEVDEVLKRGFSEDSALTKAQNPTQGQSKSKDTAGKATAFVPSAGSNKNWEQKATEWQLEAERWALPSENRQAHDMAEKAFKSAVAAYATHVRPERHMFDIAELHLGHLAKSFALRDKPSNFGRSAAASKKRDKSGRSVSKGGNQKVSANDSEDDIPKRAGVVDDDIVSKMKKLARAREADQAGEFNFG